MRRLLFQGRSYVSKLLFSPEPAGEILRSEFWPSGAAYDVSVTGVPSSEFLGFVTVSYQFTVSPSSAPSSEAFGFPVATYAFVASPLPVLSSEAVGFPGFSYHYSFAPSGFESPGAFGLSSFDFWFSVALTGVPSEEFVPSPTLTEGSVVVEPPGIATLEAFGFPRFNVPLIVEINRADGSSSKKERYPDQVIADSVATVSVFGNPSFLVPIVAAAPFDTPVRKKSVFGVNAFPHFVGIKEVDVVVEPVLPYSLVGCPSIPIVVTEDEAREIRNRNSMITALVSAIFEIMD